MEVTLDNSEIKFVPLSYTDPCGKLFTWQDNLYRGIAEHNCNHVRYMFECGLLDELMERQLFPKSKITEYVINNYKLVIEHEKINNIAYSHEWTFEMLKLAALTTLEVNKICNSYGYELKDAHPDNIVYQGSMPKFVDLGSIVKQRKKIIGLQQSILYNRSFILCLSGKNVGNLLHDVFY